MSKRCRPAFGFHDSASTGRRCRLESETARYSAVCDNMQTPPVSATVSGSIWPAGTGIPTVTTPPA